MCWPGSSMANTVTDTKLQACRPMTKSYRPVGFLPKVIGCLQVCQCLVRQVLPIFSQATTTMNNLKLPNKSTTIPYFPLINALGDEIFGKRG